MHGKGGDVGLHARVADVHACERGWPTLIICVLLAISIFFP